MALLRPCLNVAAEQGFVGGSSVSKDRTEHGVRSPEATAVATHCTYWVAGGLIAHFHVWTPEHAPTLVAVIVLDGHNYICVESAAFSPQAQRRWLIENQQHLVDKRNDSHKWTVALRVSAVSSKHIGSSGRNCCECALDSPSSMYCRSDLYEVDRAVRGRQAVSSWYESVALSIYSWAVRTRYAASHRQ